MSEVIGDTVRAAAEAVAASMPDDIVAAALEEAKQRAAEVYRDAPVHFGDAERPPFALPADAALQAVLAGPFAVNAERFVLSMSRNGTPVFGAESQADLTLAQKSAVAQLVRTYNDTEQLLAARLAGLE